jgi:SAM-dependent methyltransferase
MTMEDLKGDKSLHPDRIHVSFDQTNQQYLWDDEQCDTPVNWLGGTSIINRLVRNALVQHLGHDCGSNRGGRSHSKRELRVLDVGCGIGGMLYALLPSPATLSSSSSVISTSSSSSSKTTTSCGCWERLWYHGVSASAAEIYHANLLAEAHGLVVVNGAKQAQHQEDDDDRPNLNFHLNIQFQQVDFGQPGALPTDQYTAAIAIESLSYSQNISNTLMNLYKTLPSGGVLVVVDDVAAFDRSTQKRQQQKQQGTAGERRMKQLSLISARPSFLTHAQWIHEFDKVGFVIQDAVDIGLEYDLPELFTAEAFARRAIKWIGYTFLRPWIQQILTLVRKGHVQTNGTDNTWWDRLAVYTGVIELVHDSLSQMKAAALRKEAHQRSDLTYNMYVCVK